MARTFYTSMFALLLALAVVSCRVSTPRLASGYLPRMVSPTAPISYHVKREVRTIRAGTGGYTTNMDIEFDATLSHGAGSSCNFAVSHFVGVDLDKTETRHLRSIASTIEKQSLTRTFDAFGPTSELEFTNYNPAGWAGMMTAKALGRYETGYFGTRFPEKRLAIGDVWQSESDLAKEAKGMVGGTQQATNPLYKNIERKQVGGEARYKLVSVEPQGTILVAKFSYSCSGTLTEKFETGLLEGGTSENKTTESGTIVVDLSTGWPVSAEITLRTETTWKGKTSIDQTTTIVRRR